MKGPSPRAENRKRQAPRTQPRIERLEERLAPATFKVNTLMETVAVNLQNGRDSSGHISLLSAIMAADARGGNNTIILPSGTITADDFVIDTNLTIKGKSAASTIISGNDASRGFDIHGGKVTISNLTIEKCLGEDEGGAILNEGGKVELSSVKIINNLAVGSGGNAGTNGSNGQAVATSGGAGQGGGNAEGGGICNEFGSITVVNSLISNNSADGGNGGSGGSGGSAQGFDGSSGMNGGSGVGGTGGAGGAGGLEQGGGVFNAAGAILTIIGTSITFNFAHGGSGGDGGQGGTGEGGSGGADVGAGAGAGGNGTGGAGGAGGAAGSAEGGGLFNSGSATLSGSVDTFSTNVAEGGSGGYGGGGGSGGSGGGGSENFTTGLTEAMGPGELAGKVVWGDYRPAVASRTARGGRSRAWWLRPSRRTWPLEATAVPAVMGAPAMVVTVGTPATATAAMVATVSVVPVALRAHRPSHSVAD